MNDNKKLAALLEPLQTAIELERQGMKFFRQAAASTKGEVARRTFHFLAAEEEKHVERIKQFYQTLAENGLESLPKEFPGNADARMEEFKKSLAELSRTITASTTDAEAYETALAFENGAEKFYTEELEKADNTRVKNFYQWLIGEEEMHSRLLNSCLEFVNDPEQWFKQGPKE